MTIDELKQYNGKDGAKAYIAYKNVVYDVTDSPLWSGGEHEGMHFAGVDLTAQLANAPHGSDVFKELPVVAKLEDAAKTQEDQSSSHQSLKSKLSAWYKKYHPHPAIVHFPIALHLFAAGMDGLFLMAPNEAYVLGVFYTFFVATVMGFVAMIPGILSWWVNYNFSMRRAFVIKLIVSTITLLLGVVAIGIYYENPQAVYEYSFEGVLYHAIVLVTGLNVIILGYYGGKITWGYGRYQTLEQESSEPISVAKDEKIVPHRTVSNSISILIGGAAGTGIATLERVLSDAFKESGFYIFSTKEYMSRVRGGSNTTLIRISDAPMQAPCWEVDISIALDADALKHMQPRWSQKSIIFADETFGEKGDNLILVAMRESAKKFGSSKYANSYMAGLLFGYLSIDKSFLLQTISERFKDDAANIEVAELGYKDALKLENRTTFKLPKVDIEAVKKLHLMDGTTACGFGFLTGGCNMVTSYPMSPSTGVLNFMAAMSKEFDIALEQSEDEIASLHMVLGGWYSGARAMTTTSGGGFALMGEALSLSGMTETPAVIYLAQRPGPATGLPTRSEQGDLNMATHSGHGPFPRVVLAPGSLRESVEYGYLAFELADRFQTPVVVLSDQYLADSISMIEDVDFASYEQRRYIVKTEEEYERYADTQNGISPRGIPGLGEGLICSVGDEHDERGQITEDYKMREQMVVKRARKKSELIKEAVAPEVFGDGDIAIVGWGSTKGSISEALLNLKNPRLAQLHFAWVYPLSKEQLSVLEKFSHIIVVENNADGAFADQLKLHSVKIDDQILQSNGFNFFADQLSTMIEESIKEIL
ncbi:MAG: 2-oxoacid:acceptor oxidoreductase subunit alpha [Sulfurimonas sp.]|uniref:2-oxoacid:acceptor oxidoreductase subunit alpha n=1 Tax=Sulfurimonas sp. TaxID=2022749 RepID=UPI0028CDEE70|nr:2-oxoacid:acceptor oxidoreductase subunit alpha [Sulfurimonas sp.]MDT8338298.1 2-oxoacid:acceptor oxidoreductase subunit alpha [Sulfurimonas sp.]